MKLLNWKTLKSRMSINLSLNWESKVVMVKYFLLKQNPDEHTLKNNLEEIDPQVLLSKK